MGRLSGKVAIVTGAAGGQGEAEARLFALEGAKVVATDLQEELLNSVVAEINESGGDAIAVKQNVAEKADWEQVIKLALEKFGRIDILVNNAGIVGDRLGFKNDGWKKVMEINLHGAALGMDHVVPEMKKVGGGSIVNISSISGLSSLSGFCPYTASKGALRAISKAAARDFAGGNIRVNSVYPGYIVTPMLKAVHSIENEATKNALLALIPLNRMGLPEDIANAVLFLASDEANFVTGAELIVDGGQLIR